jgi:hypothetical protein
MKKIILILMILTCGISYSSETTQESDSNNTNISGTETTSIPEVQQQPEQPITIKTAYTPQRLRYQTHLSYSFNEGAQLKGVDKYKKNKNGYDINLEFLTVSKNSYFVSGFGFGFSQHPSYTVTKDEQIISDVTFKSIPLYLVGKVYIVPESFFVRPYIKAVAGYSFNLGSESMKVTDQNGNSYTKKSSIKDGLYYGAGIGLNFDWVDISLMETYTQFSALDNNMKALKTTLGFSIEL